MNLSTGIISLLKEYENFGKVIEIPLSKENLLPMEFTVDNVEMQQIDLADTAAFTRYVFNLLERNHAKVGYGGYGESRAIYKRSSHFQGKEARSVHLGIDLWTKAYTAVFTPLDAIVHSFADNEGFGNYGPTIILRHQIKEEDFYTLYGHLTKKSLKGLRKGKTFTKGDKIGEIGNFPENGDWPPHLHFQVIADMMGWEGDFPGVAKPSEREKYLSVCPDPNLILGIKGI